MTPRGAVASAPSAASWVDLGPWFPAELKYLAIEEGLMAWLLQSGYTSLVDAHGGFGLQVFHPDVKREGTEVWHHDQAKGHAPRARFPFVGLWSSGTPTQFRRCLSVGDELTVPEDDDRCPEIDLPIRHLVIVDNRQFEHRAPPPEAGRWLARFYVESLHA